MVLIRPLLETNSERRHVRHTVIFFIFAVCNCGGCLLPIGDPPLFLGYLQGVDFLWTLSLWPQWLLVNGSLVLIYYAWDHFLCYPHETKADIVVDELRVRRMQFRGIWPNAVLAGGRGRGRGVVGSGEAAAGTELASLALSPRVGATRARGVVLAVGQDAVRRENNFNYGAIIEVAALFFGIFLCMQPALQILEVKGSELGIDLPWEFFWGTGALSSVLDNAPTYLVFFKAAQSLHAGGGETIAGVNVEYPGSDQPGGRLHGRDDLHRQRPEFHGQGDRRKVRRADAQLLRLHGLQLLHPATAVRAGDVRVLPLRLVAAPIGL